MKAVLPMIAAAFMLAGCPKTSEPPRPKAAASAVVQSAPAARPHPAGIDWRYAASDADVDAAFALASAQHKPVFVYWGAKWCPPCNQVKATLFNRVDFIERSRAFVPVYIDGDSPGAQKLGTRFAVRGYPTMVLFAPNGAEITRLPGEVDASQYSRVLTLSMDAQRPLKAVLDDARGGRTLAANDWQLLAFYSWETDEQRLVSEQRLPALLKQLAAACPADQSQAATRLWLKAAAAESENAKKPAPDAAMRGRVLQVLADPQAARTHMDVLSNNAAEIVRAVSAPKTVERQRVSQAFDAAMQRLQADTTLSRADRLTALQARVDLARIDQPRDTPTPSVPAALKEEVRQAAQRMDREITDGYERQAVITEAAYTLAEAGLLDESDALLQANLAKSHSPYYLMSELAANARKRGDKAAALRWSQQAYDRAEGPATQLQWGASLVKALVELSPQDEVRIEATAHRLFEQAAAQPDAFYERSARSLQRAGAQLLAWNKGQAHAASLRRLHTQLEGLCARLPAGEAQQRAACEAVLTPAAAARNAA